jgi:hypothetical protein
MAFAVGFGGNVEPQPTIKGERRRHVVHDQTNKIEPRSHAVSLRTGSKSEVSVIPHR